MTTIFVHGYNYDIAAGDDPEQQYRYWREFVSGDVVPLKWQSMPQGGPPEAWKTGHWNTYHWAWTEAVDTAAPALVEAARKHSPVTVVCHSLGSRVTYEAMSLAPQYFKKVLTFNGADNADHARKCIESAASRMGPRTAKILCVMTRSDNVLRWMGRIFTPHWGSEHVVGYDGLKKPWPKGWDELLLTKDQADGPGWEDHSYSFMNPRLWGIWRKFLSES